MEEQLLPLPALKPAYEKAVWLHVYRDFSGNDADRAAERICLRFGFSSYPQHHLVHPVTLARLADTGRSVESFLGSFARAKVGKIGTTDAAGRIEATQKSFWYGFTDDVVVRIAQTPEGTRVDVRSKSRVGRSDLGQNAKRIRIFLAKLRSAVG